MINLNKYIIEKLRLNKDIKLINKKYCLVPFNYNDDEPEEERGYEGFNADKEIIKIKCKNDTIVYIIGQDKAKEQLEEHDCPNFSGYLLNDNINVDDVINDKDLTASEGYLKKYGKDIYLDEFIKK